MNCDVSDADENNLQEQSISNHVEHDAEVDEASEAESMKACDLPVNPAKKVGYNVSLSQEMKCNVVDEVVTNPKVSKRVLIAKKAKAVEELRIAKDIIRSFFSNLDPAAVEASTLPAILRALCKKNSVVGILGDVEATLVSSDERGGSVKETG